MSIAGLYNHYHLFQAACILQWHVFVVSLCDDILIISNVPWAPVKRYQPFFFAHCAIKRLAARPAWSRAFFTCCSICYICVSVHNLKLFTIAFIVWPFGMVTAVSLLSRVRNMPQQYSLCCLWLEWARRFHLFPLFLDFNPFSCNSCVLCA